MRLRSPCLDTRYQQKDGLDRREATLLREVAVVDIMQSRARLEGAKGLLTQETEGGDKVGSLRL